jgi:hypothetical protein
MTKRDRIQAACSELALFGHACLECPINRVVRCSTLSDISYCFHTPNVRARVEHIFLQYGVSKLEVVECARMMEFGARNRLARE